MEVTNTSSSFADPLAINDDGGSSLVSEPEKYEYSNIDQALETAGDDNRYQRRALLIFIAHWLAAGMFIMMLSFINQDPVFMCPDQASPTGYSECKSYKEGCANGRLAEDQPSSIVIDLGLYCEREYLKSIGSTLLLIGGSAGSVVGSIFADLKGRKTTLFGLWMAGIVLLIGFGLFNFGVATYFFFIFFTWAALAPYITISNILINEQAGSKTRHPYTSALMVGWALGEVVLIGLASFIGNWRILMVATGIIAAALSLAFPLILESPRFLLANGRKREAEIVLEKIAEVNLNEKVVFSLQLEKFENDEAAEEAHTDFWALIKKLWGSHFRIPALSLSVWCLYLYLTYNATFFGLPNLKGNIYVNSLISAMAEIIAYAVSYFIIPRLGRKKTLNIGLILNTVFGFAFLLFPLAKCDSLICNQEFLQAIGTMIVKFSICIAVAMVYVYPAEIFPTRVRGGAVGICLSLGQVGSFIGPMILSLAQKFEISQMVFYGLLSLITLFTSIPLPETFNKKLPESFNEAKEVVDHTRFFSRDSILDNEEKNVAKMSL